MYAYMNIYKLCLYKRRSNGHVCTRRSKKYSLLDDDKFKSIQITHTKRMSDYSCAAAHLCVAPHIPFRAQHKCRVCKKYLHVFCAGKGRIPPNEEELGNEYDCVKCCNGILLECFKPPSSALTSTSRPSTSVVTTTGSQCDTPSNVSASSSTSSRISRPSASSSVTEKEWMLAVNELPNTDALKKKTIAKQYPKVWKVVGKYTKQWISLKWEMSCKMKNLTDFKQKVARHIVDTRKYLPFESVTNDYRAMYKELFPQSSKVFVYSKSAFQQYARNRYEQDQALIVQNEQATASDTLRLYTIVLLGDNRDALISLNAAKSYSRSDVDSPLGRTGTIFHRLSQQFNDPDMILVRPERSLYLTSADDIIINDCNRIAIPRDHEWLQALYFKTLKEYKKAMDKWKMGTGGGSGAPENYADWNERDEEDFSKYGGVRGDVLAWIYMLDKQAGFPILEVYHETHGQSWHYPCRYETFNF